MNPEEPCSICGSLFSNVIGGSVSLLHGLHLCTGKCVICLTANGKCNQSHNGHINYEFHIKISLYILIAQ